MEHNLEIYTVNMERDTSKVCVTHFLMVLIQWDIIVMSYYRCILRLILFTTVYSACIGKHWHLLASGEALRSGTKIAAPYERLALSLLSPMPNEQDFAVNVCTVLAADHSNRLPLGATPHILDFLLAHAGVYNHCEYNKLILSNCWVSSFFMASI